MPHRLICDILEEMRKAHETRNYSYLLGLIEEAQSAANQMESALYRRRDGAYAIRQILESRPDAEITVVLDKHFPPNTRY